MSSHAFRHKFDPVTRTFGTDKEVIKGRPMGRPRTYTLENPVIPDCPPCDGTGLIFDHKKRILRPCVACLKHPGKIAPQKNLP